MRKCPSTQTIKDSDGFYTIFFAMWQTMVVWSSEEAIVNLGSLKGQKDMDVWVKKVIRQHKLSRGKVDIVELDDVVQTILNDKIPEDKIFAELVSRLPLPTETAINYCLKALQVFAQTE